MMEYQTKDRNPLKRVPGMFFWRGRYFSGLVSAKKTAPVFNGKGEIVGEKTVGQAELYDDPEDSFAAHVGIQSSLDAGLIAAIGQQGSK